MLNANESLDLIMQIENNISIYLIGIKKIY